MCIHGLESCRGTVFVGVNIQLHRDHPLGASDGDLRVQNRILLLFVSTNKLMGGFHQGQKSRHVQRLGILFVAPHGPWSHQGGFAVACFEHGHRPTIVIIVLDHAGGPLVVLPQAGFLSPCVFAIFCLQVVTRDLSSPSLSQGHGRNWDNEPYTGVCPCLTQLTFDAKISYTPRQQR